MSQSKKPRVAVTKDSRGHIHIRLNAGLKATLGRGAVKDAKAKDHWLRAGRVGQYEIWEGAGVDGGMWKAKGRGESVTFKSRREAEEHAHASSEDKAKAKDAKGCGCKK